MEDTHVMELSDAELEEVFGGQESVRAAKCLAAESVIM